MHLWQGSQGHKGSLACCSPWGRRVRHDWATELNWLDKEYLLLSVFICVLKCSPKHTLPWLPLGSLCSSWNLLPSLFVFSRHVPYSSRPQPFLAPGTGFCRRQFFHGSGVGDGLGMIQVHYIYCVLYLYYYYIVIEWNNYTTHHHWPLTESFHMHLQATDSSRSLCSQTSLLMIIRIRSRSPELAPPPQLHIGSSDIRFS